jgi:hypothetical protein
VPSRGLGLSRRVRTGAVEHAQREIGTGGRFQRTSRRSRAALEDVLPSACLQFADEPADALTVHRAIACLGADDGAGRPLQRKGVHAGRVDDLAMRHREGRLHGVDVLACYRQIVGEHPLEKRDLLDRCDCQIAVQPEVGDVVLERRRSVVKRAQMCQLAVAADRRGELLKDPDGRHLNRRVQRLIAVPAWIVPRLAVPFDDGLVGHDSRVERDEGMRDLEGGRRQRPAAAFVTADHGLLSTERREHDALARSNRHRRECRQSKREGEKRRHPQLRLRARSVRR